MTSNCFSQNQEFSFPQFRREHLPAPIDEVVRFINQEDIAALRVFKIAPQVDIGIKEVVVVADNNVCRSRQVKR